MPDTQVREYNPLINGFSDADGPMDISLNEAKNRFGRLPSIYGIVSENKRNQKRRENKVLNLNLGYFIKDLLERKKINLKGDVHQFFNAWHRDLEKEFGIHTPPFSNFNDTRRLKGLIRENKALIDLFSTLDIKQQLSDGGFIRKDILNSIPPDLLLEKSSRILQRKLKASANKDRCRTQKILNDIHCHATLMEVQHLTGEPLLSMDDAMIQGFTDEICSHLITFNTHSPLLQIEALTARKGKGIEFEYATRDDSFLKLGKITSDCTADKRGFQSDINIENIFWTVFSWILDRNYQILKVYFNNEFVMKVHLLPLFVSASGGAVEFQSIAPGRSDYMILAVDAIETTVAFRGGAEGAGDSPLDRHRDEIFSKTMECILGLADRMNIHDIYAEKFSNTPWVRQKLNGCPEIFLHVDHIIKIDQLEDVYYLAQDLSDRYGYDTAREVFMEIQMKNTFLQPGYINKAPRVKSFGLIRGHARDGIPMKQIIGI